EGPLDAVQPRLPPPAGRLRGHLARRHGVHRRLLLRHHIPLPRSSSNRAMPVEPRRGHSGCLCNCCQTFLPNCPGCHHTCPRGLGQRNTDLQCSLWITTLLSNDFGACSVNPCASFMNATAMAFLSWLARVPAFIRNLWTAVHRIQKS
uniref:Uncharacterized protein n=1 Tax=Aegilops tauschii subsp. strangulata TaxID=200361 RepID=A0A453DF86_AEGTS